MAKSFTASRAFDHKKFGRLGLADFTVESKSDIGFLLNGKELPAASIDHLLTFALQSLQDAYAGAENAEDAQERFDAKLGRILAGTLGTRTGGTGATALTVEIRNLLRPQIKAAFTADEWKALDADARDEKIDAVFAEQSPETQAAIEEAAKAEIARKAAEKAAKAGLLAALSIKL